MGKINVEWHKEHRMPKGATLDQRLSWHLEHHKHCACRTDLPKSIADEIKRRQEAR